MQWCSRVCRALREANFANCDFTTHAWCCKAGSRMIHRGKQGCRTSTAGRRHRACYERLDEASRRRFAKRNSGEQTATSEAARSSIAIREPPTLLCSWWRWTTRHLGAERKFRQKFQLSTLEEKQRRTNQVQKNRNAWKARPVEDIILRIISPKSITQPA